MSKAGGEVKKFYYGKIFPRHSHILKWIGIGKEQGKSVVRQSRQTPPSVLKPES